MSANHHLPSMQLKPPDTGSSLELQRYQQTKKITIVGAIVNVILSALKIFIGIIGHSQALVADGVHSLSDLLTDILVIVAARHAAQDADVDHP